MEEAENIYSTEISAKSKGVYEKEYEKFSEWRCAQNVSTCNENLIVAYFSHLSKVYKTSSLWCAYSKLKRMLYIKESIDISKFHLVTEFMKSNNIVGDEDKKSLLVLQRDQIQEFMLKAPDHKYLLVKVATAFAMFGACRCDELHDLRVQDVSIEGSVLLVKICQDRKYTLRHFTIIPNDDPVDYIAIYNKYVVLRPKDVRIESLFLSYHNGKCSSQPVGKNTFGKMPRMIAEFLKLPDANKYTGHCFRRSAATILAESGGDKRTQKRFDKLTVSLRKRAAEKRLQSEYNEIDNGQLRDFELKFMDILEDDFSRDNEISEASVPDADSSNELHVKIKDEPTELMYSELPVADSVSTDDEIRNKRPAEDESVDDDYMMHTETPSTKRKRKESTVNMYLETLVVLKNINNSLIDLSRNVGKLSDVVTSIAQNVIKQ